MKHIFNNLAGKPSLPLMMGLILLLGINLKVQAAKIQIGALVSGQVQQVTVKVGQRVKPGQLLMQIDDQAYQAQLAMQAAALKASELKLADAQIELDQAADLYDRTVTAKREFDVAKLAYDLAEQAMLKAKAQLQSTQAWQKYYRIEAPVNAKVIAIQAPKGTTVFGENNPLILLEN